MEAVSLLMLDTTWYCCLVTVAMALIVCKAARALARMWRRKKGHQLEKKLNTVFLCIHS